MEQRLIDADALKARIQAWKDRLKGYYGINDDMVITLDKVQKQIIDEMPAVDAVPVDFINQKIVELQSCANQHFDDGHEILATCVLETIRLLGSFLKEWRGKEQADE